MKREIIKKKLKKKTKERNISETMNEKTLKRE